MNTFYSHAASAALAALALLAGTAAHAQTYSVTPLGTPAGSTWSQPKAINDQGEVAGESYYPNVGKRPFIYFPSPAHGQPAGFTILGRLGDSANDMNHAGQVVGGGPSGLGHAFLWEDGVTRDLTTYSGPNGVSAASFGWRLDDARDISEQGQVVCFGQLGQQLVYRSVLWGRDALGNVMLTVLPDRADCANDSARVLTAAVNPATGLSEPCLYDGGTGMVLAFLPPAFGYGWALNNNDEGINQTGQIYLPAARYGLPAGVSWLGSLGGTTTYTRGILDNGLVVGYSTKKNGVFRAFRWSNGVMTDLNTVANVGRDWDLQRATGVASSGRIVGYGTYKRNLAAFVLTPQ